LNFQDERTTKDYDEIFFCILCIWILAVNLAAQSDSSKVTRARHRQASPEQPAQVPEPSTYRSVVEANNKFAVRFFKAAFEESAQRNMLTAPASLSYLFGLLLNGATGAGREQITAAFDLKDIPVANINQGNAALWSIRQSHPVKKKDRQSSEAVGSDGRSFQPYIMASAMWVPNSAISGAFKVVNSESYKLQYFLQSPTAESVNKWASQATRGKISSIVHDEERGDFMLAAVTYFNSRWTQPFELSKTRPGEFTLLSGEKKQVPLMRQSREFSYFKGPSFQAVNLEFYDAAMLIFLPDRDSSLAAFVDSLTPESWTSLTSQFDKRPGYLEMPRFELNQERESKHILENLGVSLPFSSFATFVPMVGQPEGAILKRLHEGGSIKVDETGAEIAFYEAATGVLGGICGNCTPPEPFRMIVDRPFFFAVVDTRTKETLFMGTVVEP
jgi:serpin B